MRALIENCYAKKYACSDYLWPVHDGNEPVADGDDDIPGPQAALVGWAVIVDLAQHQVQTVLIAGKYQISETEQKYPDSEAGSCLM